MFMPIQVEPIQAVVIPVELIVKIRDYHMVNIIVIMAVVQIVLEVRVAQIVQATQVILAIILPQ